MGRDRVNTAPTVPLSSIEVHRRVLVKKITLGEEIRQNLEDDLDGLEVTVLPIPFQEGEKNV